MRNQISVRSPARRHHERARRVALWFAIATLVTLAFAPVYVHHVANSAAQLLSTGSDHLGELCLVALNVLLVPVHEFFHVLLAAGLAYATWDRVRAWRRGRQTTGWLDATMPVAGDAFWTAATSVGVDPRIVRSVYGLPVPALTVGWLQPRIYVAESLGDALTPDELRAVLAHEGAHAARRDPLRLAALRFVSCALFWLPVFRRLTADIADDVELRADDAAAGDSPLSLASAILSVASWSPSARGAVLPAGAVGFARHDLVEHRVRRLAGEPIPLRSHLTRRSALGAVVALALVWTSSAAMPHPLGAMSMSHAASHGLHPARGEEDCAKHGGSVFRHLLCHGLRLGGSHHVDCPQDGAGHAARHATPA
jgi:Zn-dependent protease with chaperone function